MRSECDIANKYLEVTEVIVVTLDPRGIVTYINRKGCELLEYDEKEIAGKNWFDNFLPERIKKKLKAEFSRFISGSLKYLEFYENPILTKNGRERDIAWHNTILTDDGKITGSVSSGEDITEKRKNEKKLALHELRLQSLLKLNKMINVPVEEIINYTLEAALKITESECSFICFLNKDENKTNSSHWSKNARKKCKIPNKSMDFPPIKKAGLWAESIRQRKPVIINDFERSKYPEKGCPDRHIIIKRIMSVPVFNGTAKIVAACCVANKAEEYSQEDALALATILNDMWNITERNRIEQELLNFKNHLVDIVKERTLALSQSEELFRNLFESGPIGMALLSPEGKFLKVNEALSNMTGFKEEELLNMGNLDMTHPDEREICEFAINKALMEKKQVKNLEKRYLKKSNEYIWVSMTTNPIYDKNGNALYLLAMIEDIQERKIAAEELKKRSDELERINKELESFSYSVSHDLRAPLRSIEGFSRIIVDDCGHDLSDSCRNYLDRICKSSKDMGILINDLLNLSRVSRVPMTRSEIDLSAMVKNTCDQLAKENSDRKSECVIEPGIKINADEHLLKIAVENLIENAWKFTKPREVAKIEFGISERDNERIYFIRDNGVGFDMKYVPMLFTPFHRLHKAEEFPGTGIGLATVQRIINRHGGKIWAEGAIDHGAVFNFIL